MPRAQLDAAAAAIATVCHHCHRRTHLPSQLLQRHRCPPPAPGANALPFRPQLSTFPRAQHTCWPAAAAGTSLRGAWAARGNLAWEIYTLVTRRSSCACASTTSRPQRVGRELPLLARLPLRRRLRAHAGACWLPAASALVASTAQRWLAHLLLTEVQPRAVAVAAVAASYMCGAQRT